MCAELSCKLHGFVWHLLPFGANCTVLIAVVCCAVLCLCRDFIGWGYKPHLEVLDKLLACLRLQLPKSPQRPAVELQQRALQLQAQLQALPHPDAPGDLSAGAAGSSSGGSSEQWLSTQALLRDLANQRRSLSLEERPYEVPFDKRAIDAVGDAISMGILPAIKVRAHQGLGLRAQGWVPLGCEYADVAPALLCNAGSASFFLTGSLRRCCQIRAVAPRHTCTRMFGIG